MVDYRKMNNAKFAEHLKFIACILAKEKRPAIAVLLNEAQKRISRGWGAEVMIEPESYIRD